MLIYSLSVILGGHIIKTGRFNTDRIRRGIRIIPILLFLFSFSVFSGNLNNFAETDFPSPNPKFENFDQDYLLDNQPNKLDIPGPDPFPVIAETTLFKKCHSLSYKKSSPDQNTLILRC